MQISLHYVEMFYTESKFWLALIGGLWSVFRGIEWIKSIKTNDLHHIQLGVDSLHAEVKDQTTQIVTELRELRGDVRMFVVAATKPRTAKRRKKK